MRWENSADDPGRAAVRGANGTASASGDNARAPSKTRHGIAASSTPPFLVLRFAGKEGQSVNCYKNKMDSRQRLPERATL